MSNVIPIVSSSPPPLDDTPSFEESPGHHEDFGGFATASSAKDGVFKPITSDTEHSFASFPADEAVTSGKAECPSEHANGVDTGGQWADFAGFSGGPPPPPDLPNGEEEDDFGDFAACQSSNTFQDSNRSNANVAFTSVTNSEVNSVNNTNSADNCTNSSEANQSNVQSPAAVPSDSKEVVSSVGDLDDTSAQTLSNCKSVKPDSQDNTSQGSVTDSGLSSDTSPGLKLEDFTEFPTDGKESIVKTAEQTEKGGNVPEAESKPGVGNSQSQVQANDINSSDGSCTVTSLDPQPLVLRPVASFSKVDPESYPEDDSGTFGQFEDFAKPGTFETGSDSDTKVSDNFPADSDSQREEDSEFEEFKKNEDSDSSMPNDTECSVPKACDNSDVVETTPADIPRVQIDDTAEEEFEDFQDSLTSVRAENVGATDVASPESGYSDRDIHNSDALSGDALPYQSENQNKEGSSPCTESQETTAEVIQDTTHSIPNATHGDTTHSKQEEDECTTGAPPGNEEESKSGEENQIKELVSQACDTESQQDDDRGVTVETGVTTETGVSVDTGVTMDTIVTTDTGITVDTSSDTSHVQPTEVSPQTAQTEDTDDMASAETKTDFSRIEPPPITEDSDEDDFADFADFKSSGVGAVAPAPDPVDNGGWAAFGGEDAKPADDSADDWAAFSEPATGNTEHVDGFGDFSSKTKDPVDDDEDDDFGDFGDHTTTPILPKTESSPPSTFKQTEKLFHPNLNVMLDQCCPLPKVRDGDESYVETLAQCLSVEVLRKQDLENHNTHPGQSHPRQSKSVMVDLNVWNNLKELEHTAALKYSWNQSNNNKCLLKAVGIDTRNILIGHKKLPMPIFASSLGLLEPMKGVESKKEKSSLPPDPLLQPISATPVVISVGTPQQDIPPAEFDWGSAGLTNPLDALEKEQELLQALEPQRSEAPKVLQPLESFLTNLKYQSAPPSDLNKKHNLDCLTPQASKLLQALPDMGFMRAKMLMFPMRGATE